MSAQHSTGDIIAPDAFATPKRVMIIGVHDSSDAYPNVKYRVLGLLQAKGVSLREFRYTFHWRPFSSRHQGQRNRLLSRIGFALNALGSHLRALWACVRHGHGAAIYIPYPAPLILFCLSFLPRFLRPRKIIVDAFISLYDTVVSDRQLLTQGSFLAAVLLHVERRAYLCADQIVTDTEINSLYFKDIFNLPEGRAVALPLAIGEHLFGFSPYEPRKKSCTVLFIGTFVPLQGTEIIARAIAILQDQPAIHFRIIGQGQTAAASAEILATAGCRNFDWITQWQEAEVLAAEIRDADICLGIFGTTEKTQRVWPFKNYLYMASGRPLITGDTAGAREMAAREDSAPFVLVQTGDPQALADAILLLAGDTDGRRNYARRSRSFYEKYLSNSISIDAILQELLR